MGRIRDCKYLTLLCVLLLAGCSARRRPKIEPSALAIPRDCIVGAMVTPGKTNCVGIDKGQALCDGVVVKFACVQFLNSKEKP